MKGFEHGINLGGWLSQCIHTKEHYDSFIHEDDIKTIKNWGLDHVRIPVDYNLVQNKDGSFKEEGFVYIQNAINWCKSNDINIILDLHKTAGYSFDVGENEGGFFDNEKYQEMFYTLWEEFSKRYSKYEDMLQFELLNEVTDKEYSERWNSISRKCVERIRKIAPTIKILVGSYWNNSFDALRDLDSPYDKNIIYNFHCYEPLVFTHQGGEWVSPKMTKDIKFALSSPFSLYQSKTLEVVKPDCANFTRFNQNETVTPEYFETIFADALKVAKERNVELYCGEYGVIDCASPEEALEWYRMITTVLNRHNIGRAAWSYKQMNFGISDKWMDSIRPELLKLL